MILGISEAPQDVSFAAMAERQQALAEVDPAGSGRREPVVVHRRRRHQHDAEQRPHPDQPEAARGARRRAPATSSAGCSPSWRRSRASRCSCSRCRTSRSRPRQPHAVSSTASRIADAAELDDVGAAAASTSLQQLPELRDVASDQQNAGLQAQLVIDRDTAVASRHHAADDRRHALRRLRPAADLDHVHAAQPVPRRAGSAAGVSAEPRRPAEHLRARRRAASAVPLERLHATRRQSSAPLSINHQGQFPVRHDLVQPGAGASLGRGRRAPSSTAKDELDMPPSIQAGFQGTAEAFQASLANEPLLILAALVTVYIVLGRALRELHPPDHDSLDAAVGGRGRAARADALRAWSSSVIALIGIILLIGIVKKNAIMMIDFALEAERKEGKTPEEAIYRSLPAAVPADHDDHDGGAARRACRWRSAPASARSCGGRWASRSSAACSSASAHALHDAGRSTSRSIASGQRRSSRAVGRGEPVREPLAERHEPLGALHSPAGRHDAADGRDRAGRRASALHVAAGRRRCRRSTFPRSRSRAGAARRQSGDDGVVGGHAARAAVRAHRRRHRDDLDQLRSARPASRCSSISTATSTPPRATCRRPSTPRAGNCPPNLPNNPSYRKVNPADAPILILALTSDTVDRGQMYDVASSILQQKLAQVEGVGQVSVGGGSLPAVRVEVNPTVLNQLRPRPGRRPRAPRPREREPPERRAGRRRPHVGDSARPISCSRPTTTCR